MSTSGVSLRGPRAVVVELSAAEREQLERWARRPKSAQALAQRSRIVLACAAGATNQGVAERLGVSVPTVRKWRGRFALDRLEGLLDEPRSGRPRSVTDEQVEEVIVRTLESAPPDGGTHWSTRQMAKASGLSQTTISKVWRAFGLQPHRVEHWKLSKDPELYERMSKALEKIAAFVEQIDNGQGTLGKLYKDPSLYDSLNQATAEITKLIYDLRQDPKKYLTIRFRLF